MIVPMFKASSTKFENQIAELLVVEVLPRNFWESELVLICPELMPQPD